MEIAFIRRRISELRMQKGVSEYKMSLDLGHSKGYVQSISSGRALPSLMELLYICDYFGITPRDFFDPAIQYPALLSELNTYAADLGQADLQMLVSLAERLRRQ